MSRLLDLINTHIDGKPEFVVIGGNLRCEACIRKINIRPQSVKHCIKSHEESARHKEKLKYWSSRKVYQQSTTELLKRSIDDFTFRLTEVLVSMNVPWVKANNIVFKQFVQDYCKRTSPDESTMRKYYLEPLYKKHLNDLRNYIGVDSWIYLQIDEAKILERKIISILVGKLDGKQPKTYLLNLYQIEKSADNSLIQKAILESLSILWPDKLRYDNVRLLLSDQAGYLLKSSKMMKDGLYQNMLHITCLCHALHRVCLSIRDSYPTLVKMISLFINVFKNSSRKIALFEQATGSKMPSFPVETRWGTWIDFCTFLNHNFDSISSFLPVLKEEEQSKSMDDLIVLVNSTEVRLYLLEVYKTSKITETIRKLEKRGLEIREQRKLIDDIREDLPDEFKTKLDDCLRKNPDYETIFKQSSHEFNLKYLYAPLTSVEVERSFSQLKNILTERRNHFLPKNLMQYAFIYYNQKVE